MDLLQQIVSLSDQDASRVLLRQRICKEFDGQPFRGTVARMKKNVKDANGQTWPRLFNVKYEDGDVEDLAPEDVVKYLVNPQDVVDRLEALPNVSTARPLQTAKEPSTEKPAKRARKENTTNSSSRGAAAAASGSPSLRENGPAPMEQDRRPAAPTARRSKHANTQATQSQRQQQPTQGTQRQRQQASQFTQATLPFYYDESAAAPYANSAPAGPVPENADGCRTAGLPGHIKSIEVVDFMCHHHMAMDFAPHVTFISGENGSGKSATLQALQCCLGVKAAKTGRAGALKGFIRTGADEAIVRVTIYNTPYDGYDAYQHDMYGDFITVERKISKTGNGGMALKDAHGRKVSTRRDDLDAMLSALNINASNPVTVMTQDAAKTFLAGSGNKGEEEKFELYMDATQLGVIAENLAISRAKINGVEKTVVDLNNDIEITEGAFNELEKRVKHVRSIDGWQDEVQRLEKCAYWGAVEEIEENRALLEEKLAMVPERHAEGEAKLQEAKTELEALTAMVAQKKTFLTSFDTNADKLSKDEKEAKSALKKEKIAAARLQRKVTEAEQLVKDAIAHKEAVMTALESADHEAAAQAQQAAAQYTQGVEEAKLKHKEASAVVEECKKANTEAAGALTAAKDALYGAKTALQTAEGEVRALESDIKALKNASATDAHVHKFGGQVPVNIVRAINQAVQQGRFHRPPLGPVGRYVTIEDPNWAVAIDSAIGMALHAFIVSDKHDVEVFNSIMNQLGIPRNHRPRLCCMRMNLPRHNIPPQAIPAANITTVLQLLHVNDPAVEATVFNYLVDQAKVETLALAQNISEASRLAKQHRVSTAYTVDGQKAYQRGSTLTTEPVPFWMRNNSNVEARAKDRLCGNANAQQAAAALQNSLKEARNKLRDYQRAVSDAEVRVNEADRVAKECRLALCEARKTTTGTQATVNDLLSQMPAELAATQIDQSNGGIGGGGDGDEQTGEVYEATQAVLDYEAQLEDAKKYLVEAEAKVDEAAKVVERIQEESARLDEENADFVNSYDADIKRLKAAEQRLKNCQEQVAGLESKREELQKKLNDANEAYGPYVEMAEMLCSREEAAEERQRIEQALVAEGKDRSDEYYHTYFLPDNLNMRIDRLKVKIAKTEAQAGGSREELESEYAKMKTQLNRVTYRQREAVDVHKILKHSWKTRKRKLQEMDQTVEGTVNMRFNDYMKRKGHVGRVHLDRSNRRLTLAVRIGERASDGSGAVKDLKQLSGGERSYTTVSFTLALRGETDSPFVAMDEADVFMDNINRRVAFENLFTFAREQGELQMLLLSPLSVSVIGDVQRNAKLPGSFVKVVEMMPARAGTGGGRRA